MKLQLSLFLIHLLFAHTEAWSSDLDISKTRCSITTAGESFVYQNDFENPALHLNSKWWWTLPEMEIHFETLYNSGKRLNLRAYYDAATDQFYLPIQEVFGANSHVVAPEFFINSIRRHIEAALENKYAEYIYFPDMGHSHFYIEESHWNSQYADLMKKNPSIKGELYTQMLADPELKMLYHTAEKLLTSDEQNHLSEDPHLQFRFWNRNILGDNKMSSHLEVHFPEHPNSGNTVGSIPNYRVYSAGHNIHASKDGCFPYTHNGQTYYFDISLESVEYDPSLPTADFW